MMNPIVLASILISVSVLVAAVGASYVYSHVRTQRVRRRLQDATATWDAELEPDITRDLALSPVPMFDDILQRFRLTRHLRELILQADASLTVGSLLGLMIGVGALGGLATTILLGNPWAAIAVAVTLATVPLMVLNHRKNRRRDSFEQQFPDALDLLTGALRSGMAFSGALQIVAEESPDPVSKEFHIVFEEHRLGVSLRDALAKMTDRIDSQELGLFVTAVVLQRDTGGNLSEILEGAAAVIRDRFRILGDVKTITAQARFSGMVLTVLPVAMAGLMMVMAPDYLKTLITDPIGPYLIVSAVVLQIVGFLAIRQIVKIKV